MKTPYVAQSTAAALPCQADSLQGSFGSRLAMWREALSLAIAFSIGLAIGLLNDNFFRMHLPMSPYAANPSKFGSECYWCPLRSGTRRSGPCRQAPGRISAGPSSECTL